MNDCTNENSIIRNNSSIDVLYEAKKAKFYKSFYRQILFYAFLVTFQSFCVRSVNNMQESNHTKLDSTVKYQHEISSNIGTIDLAKSIKTNKIYRIKNIRFLSLISILSLLAVIKIWLFDIEKTSYYNVIENSFLNLNIGTFEVYDFNKNILNKRVIHNDYKKVTNEEYCDFMHDSLLYVPNCSWSNNITWKWPLLITSTPRLGTVFTVKILNSIGIKIENDWHSPIKNISNGQVSWIDAFYEKNEFKHIGPSRLGKTRFIKVLHQVREPLKSIISMCTEPLRENSENYKFVNKHIDNSLKNIGANQTKIEIIMHFYYHWHRKLNLFGFPTFQVENLFSSDNRTVINTLDWIGLLG